MKTYRVLAQLTRIVVRVLPWAKGLIPRLRIVVPIVNADRDFLENRIFAFLVDDATVKTVLFAGVELYTWHYAKYLKGKQFCTIDIDSNKAPFGSKDGHTVGSVTQLSTFYDRDYFDVVILNGLIGYGLNSKQDVDRALAESFAILRPGGLMIIGWNNTPEHLDFVLEGLEAYQLYDKYIPERLSLTSNRIEANASNKHTFDFLTKPK
jgi:SAM-dependent methyltransferase